MTRDLNVDQVLDSWFTEGPTELPERTVAAIVDQLDDVQQRRPIGLLGRIHLSRFAQVLGGAAAVVVAAVLALAFLVNQPGLGGPQATPTSGAPSAVATSPEPTTAPSPSVESTVPSPTAEPSPTTPQPSPDHGSFEPDAGRIYCEKPISEAGAVVGCSNDGTRILVQRDGENLFVLDADGSETQVTEQLSGFKFTGPRGATISPDGSRVVFAGLTKTPEEAVFCHDGALFAVGSDGGPLGVSSSPKWLDHLSHFLSRRDPDRVRRRLLRLGPHRVGDELGRQ